MSSISTNASTKPVKISSGPGQITVADEHLASGVCDFLLTRYALLKKAPKKNGYRASWRPDVIGLSVSIVHHLPKVKSYVSMLEKMLHRPTVLLGGRPVGHYSVKGLVSDKTVPVTDLMQLSHWIASFEKQDKLLTIG